MGALLGGNADRQWGYKIGDKIVPPAIDKIDGGGPGRSGPTFEGGGLLSDIGNALTRPYGYRDRMQAVRPQMRPTGLLSTPPATPPAPAPQRVLQGGNIEDISSLPARLMPQNYFTHLIAEGRPQAAITPVGQPMTGQELLEMPRYMDQVRRWRDLQSIADGYEAPAVFSAETAEAFRGAESPAMSSAETAEAFREAEASYGGGPAVFPTAPGDVRGELLSYLAGEGVPSRTIELLAGRPEFLDPLLQAFERDGVLAINILQGLR